MAPTTQRLSKHFKSLTNGRETRSKLQANFAKPGNPGAKFKNALEKIIKCINLPKAARDELGIGDDGMMPAEPEAKAANSEEEDLDSAQIEENKRRKFQ